MSGSRDHFAGKLKQELLSALSLLFRQVGSHGVNTDLMGDCQLVVMPPALHPPATTDWLSPEQARIPATHGVTFFWNDPDMVVSLPLIEAHVQGDSILLPGSPDMPPLQCHTVSLEKTGLATIAAWQPDSHTLETVAQPVETTLQKLNRESVTAISMTQWKTKTLHRNVEAIAVKIHRLVERMWRLPLAREPVPVHRFSAAEQLVLRRQLSEKNKTVPANITLNMVFEYMDMTLFTGVQQGQRGELLCEPKPPNSPGVRDTGAGMNFFLVIGTRSDTRDVVKTLVPVSLLAL